MRAPSLAIGVSVMLIILGTEGGAWPHSGEATLAEIVAAQRQYPRRIRSLQAQFHAENHLTPEYLQTLARSKAYQPGPQGAPLPAATQRWEIAFACRGDKFVWEEKPQDPTHQSWPAQFYNGKDTYNLVYIPSPSTKKPKISSATKRKGFHLTFPHVLSFGYQLNYQIPEQRGVLWIGNVLQEGDYQLTGTETDPQFGTLYRVQGAFQNNEATFWFAPQHGWVAVRTELKPKEGESMPSVYRITKLQQVDGLWFAQSAVREMLAPSGGELRTRYTIEVASLKPNAASEALFRLKLPPGAFFFDQDNHVSYTVGEKGKRIGDQK